MYSIEIHSGLVFYGVFTGLYFMEIIQAWMFGLGAIKFYCWLWNCAPEWTEEVHTINISGALRQMSKICTQDDRLGRGGGMQLECTDPGRWCIWDILWTAYKSCDEKNIVFGKSGPPFFLVVFVVVVFFWGGRMHPSHPHKKGGKYRGPLFLKTTFVCR